MFTVCFSVFIRCQDEDHNHPRTKHQVSTNYEFEAFQDCVCSDGWERNVPRRIFFAAAAGRGAMVGLKGYPPIPPRLGCCRRTDPRLSKTVPPEAVVYSGDCSICKLLWLSNIGNIERERSRLISGTQEANNTLRLYDIIHDKQQRMKNHFEWKRYISIDVHYKWFASYRKMHVHEVGNVNFSLDSHWIFPSCPLRPRCTTGAPYM